jgi:predicted chitinase
MQGEIWEQEKKRIARLQWWNQLKGKSGFPTSIRVHHFHPLAVIENFKQQVLLITLEMLAIANPWESEHNQKILPYLNKYAVLYEINTPLRISHFLAQIGHESRFRVTEENGNYSARRMREIFGCKSAPANSNTKKYNSTTDDCNFGRLRNKLWTHESTYAHNPENLLSYVYADRMDNGNETSREGYKYRGRGIIQLTGKRNYRLATEWHNKLNPNDQQNFEENPDLIVSNFEYGIESAFIFWGRIANLNPIADKDDAKELTKRINGGLNGYNDRVEHLNKIKGLFGI